MSSVVFQGVATSNQDLFDRIRSHLTSTSLGASVVAAGGNTGNGGVSLIKFKTTSTPQTFTLVCTATAVDSGTFSVTGSTSGALGNATVGTAFTSTQIDLTISDGAIDFAIGDTFTLVAVPWVENKIESIAGSGGYTGERISYLKGPGLSNNDNIYINMRVFDHTGNDTHTFGIQGATNFDTNETYAQQPGVSPEVFATLWQNSIDYWLIANGRRFIVIAKIASTFICFYCGFILPYGTSSEYPYPLHISGNTSTVQRYSITNYSLSNFWDPYLNSAYYRDLDGSWAPVTNITSSNGAHVNNSNSYNSITPYDTGLQNIGNNADGSYGLIQPQLRIKANTTNDRLEGVFEGLQYISGFNNTSEDTVQIAGYDNDFLIIQNVYRTDFASFAAIELG